MNKRQIDCFATVLFIMTLAAAGAAEIIMLYKRYPPQSTCRQSQSMVIQLNTPCTMSLSKVRPYD